MFNLIVSSDLQNERQGSMSANRVFEYTEAYITNKFKPAGRLEIEAVCSLPTIFMDEGISNEVVNIGWLSRIELRAGEYQLQYSCDTRMPGLTNADIHAMASDLLMHDWEFSRNHWAIKDVDLFKVLYCGRTSQRPSPRVFQLSKNPIKPNLVSLMMPFSAEFGGVHQALKSALEAEKFECQRADDLWVHDHIMQDIVELICTSKVVICDLSGKNPNVLYEAGIAHTLGKDVILITQHMADVPFDLRAIRCITYLNNQEGLNRLASEVLARVVTVA